MILERLAYLKVILLIGLISVYDTALIVVYGNLINELERNPVGNWLLDVGGIPLFALVKSILTLVVVSLCILLVKTKYRVTILGVFFFQLCLFFYLTFSVGTWTGPFDGPNPFMAVLNFYIYGISE